MWNNHMFFQVFLLIINQIMEGSTPYSLLNFLQEYILGIYLSLISKISFSVSFDGSKIFVVRPFLSRSLEFSFGVPKNKWSGLTQLGLSHR